ncbi:MAG: hypothetical protein L6Q98_16375 [Anaerolineae bacterium]|nr:hypothetical protein [Anaerolineae bacterium]NUQ04255.1 hypothetical protein [Anaerolineae bacterium]
MGIKLDWEIDARRGSTLSVGEDPQSRRRRRASQFRFVLALLALLALIAGVVGAVVLRLREVDGAIERMLRETAAAEVTALRLGDQTAFLDVQWQAMNDASVTARWIAQQTQHFDAYQALMQDPDREINLTGRVLDTAVEGQNGRVHLEEIIDGVPYGQVWFYWRFDEGWRHVPMAFSFWGDARTIQGEGFNIAYREVDSLVAAGIAAELPRWLSLTCAVFDCAGLPEVTIEIVPDEALVAGWSSGGSWQLRLPSPYIERARLDQPFDPSLRLKAATLWVDRWLAAFAAQAPSDAAYLRDAIGGYLIQQFTGIDTGSHLVSSLVDAYGADVLRRLRLVFAPQTSIGALRLAANEPLDVLRVDWRDFLAYRLNTEAEWISRRAESAFYALYDTGDPAALAAAQTRFAGAPPAGAAEVASAVVERTADGAVLLRAVVGVGGGATEAVTFRLVGGDWKRAS